MKMVGHEHVAEDLPAPALNRLGQSLEHSLIITIAMKHDLPCVASRHDMVNRAGILNS
jgi:hypothetical protein